MGLRVYTDRYILTPGPTEVPRRILHAMARDHTNPDLDPSFMEIYNQTREMFKKLIGGEGSDLYIMVGEAMLGLESAVANTVARGDRVLVVANGVFGEGFSDLVRMYGAEPIVLEGDWRRSIDPSAVERELERNRDVSAITLVHCDTPSAILNDLEEISKISSSYGATLIVDAVSSVGGVPIEFDRNRIDILIAGSQKVLNTPPGLTILAVRRDLWDRIYRVGYRGFYLDLKIWREMLDEKGVFPYTMAETLVYGLNEALKMIMEEGVENVYRRHRLAQKASWRAVEALNLEPYPESMEHSSPTVTAITTPKGIDERDLRKYIWDKYGVMLAGSWGRLEGRVFRIGHMGVQASINHLIISYTALARGLRDLGLNKDPAAAVEAIETAYIEE